MKLKLIILVNASILIVTIILLFYLQKSNEKEIVNRFRAEQLVASRQLAKEIESYLRERAKGISHLSLFSSLQNHDVKKAAGEIQTFFNYVKKNHVKDISVYDRTGTIIYSTGENTIGRSCGQLDFFQWAAKRENKGRQFISSLIRKTDDTTAAPPNFRVLIAAPIYNDEKDPQYPKPTHKFVGVVTATIDLKELLAEFLPLVSPFAGKEHAWILDSNGNVLFQSAHPEMVMKNIHQPDETCIQCHISFEHFGTILSEKQGTTEYKLKERPKKLASFSSIQVMNISWKIVLYISFEEVSGFINYNLYLTFILIGIIAISLVGGSLFIFRGYRLKAHAEAEMKQLRQKRALEDKIVESEERYRTLVESSPDAIAVHCEGKIVFVNSACVKLIGAANADELIGKPAIEVVHPDDRELAFRRITEILETGKPTLTDEARFLRRDGSVIDVEVVTIPTVYKNKPAVQTVVRDITERKQVEETLQESEERFRRLFEESTDPILLLDQKYFFDCNPAALSILQLKSKDEIGNKTPWDLSPEFQPDGKLSSEKAVEMISIAKQNGYHRFEWVHTKKDGTNFFVEVMLTPIVLHGEEIFHVIWRDITERKRAEEALRENEERLRTIIETEPECVKIVDRDGQLLEMNAAGLAMLEAESLSKVQQHTLVNFILPEYRASFEALHKRVMSGENGVLEFEVMGLMGTRRWLETHAAPMHDAAGKVVKLLGVTRDITERKRAEEILRESEERFRNLVENINEVFYIADGQGKIFYCSPSITTATGYSLQEIIGKSFLRLVAPIDRRIVLDNYLEQTTKGVSDTALVFRVRCKDGKIIWAEQITRIVYDTFGNVVEYRNVARDITERKRAEEEIVSQKNRFAQLFENSPIAIALLDDQDEIVHINESFSMLFGYFLEEIKGQSLNDIIVPPELKEEAESYSDQTRAGNQINKESYRKKKDGTLVYVQIVGVPVTVNDSTVGIYGMYVDLTERKNAEEKMRMAKELAEQSNKLKSEFLAQMSHEIRTPLNAVIGNVDYLDSSLDEKMDPNTRDCFDGIKLASKRIIRTIDLILDVSELQTGAFRPSLKEIDINSKVLNKLFNEFRTAADNKGLDLTFKCEIKESKVIADEYSITQIFANLIDNAIKYTLKGKVEILLTKNKDGNIVVEVNDTGIGMSMDFLPHLFEPFVQEEMGYTRTFDGNGLGLALVKRYCEINNADIEVESKKNHGSTFKVTFKQK